MKQNAGFTLIELMIVVEIIGLLVSIAVPNYLRTRVQSNEGAAVANLRAILDAELSFSAFNNGYALDFATLTEASPPYLNGKWDGPMNGYQYRIEGDAQSFRAYATPVEFGTTGWRGFFVDPTGIIRQRLNADADATSPPLGN